ncbi:MAG: 30S ribosomal protein S1 [Desulfovibrio sp.]|jgi:small subunit ribosomal protein S1|nr:30S ribosomal protein S1 [Desulfovibrio sp.]
MTTVDLPIPEESSAPAADAGATAGETLSPAGAREDVPPLLPPASPDASGDSPSASPGAEHTSEQIEAQEHSFAEMLAEQERGEKIRASLAPGQRVTVRIVAITSDTVFVSTGSKVDGIVDREELEREGELPYVVGDTLDLYVIQAGPQEVKLSKIVRGAGGLAALEDARRAGLPVEGRVTGQVKGGYAVDIMKRRAFCPASQMDVHPAESPEAFVGKVFPFLITRLEKNGRNIVVSRRTLLEREQAEQREAILSDIAAGDVVEAVITRIAPFGAFAELAPGVEGLIHLSELSWTRVSGAEDAVSPGQRVRAKVLSLDRGEKGVRISLSIKQASEDPWLEAPGRLSPGDIVSGRVMRSTAFGVFVEVLPGVEGLAHISELSFDRRVTRPEDVVSVGETVSVKIKELDADRRRISLSLRDAAGDPWETAAEAFPLESEVAGAVERRAPFGLFVALAPGITGLLPNSILHAAGSSRKAVDRLKAGDSLQVRIKEVDRQNRRISLALASEECASEEREWKRHAAPPSPKALGSLGLALQAALQKKK